MSRLLSRKIDFDGPKIRGVQAFFAENSDMAYNFPRNPPEDPQNVPNKTRYPRTDQSIGWDIWDTMRAPMAGLFQGIVPKTLKGNLSFEEYVRKLKQKRQGLPGQPQRIQQRIAAKNWLERIIEGG